ncbi:WXG100 family type VII secretion target [Nocardioides sp.]|uniref:WXG100 family type VII secretion target n=1 Tax=Nocardioides sp. TaxID=35761 RepID=UPI0026392E2B|nr:WXG100 family type VII secretion target [Nocardioides sp.]MCW2738640.1 family type secretion target [Nocardioides sp.]
MILSGTTALDPASHAATTAAVRQRLDRLEERRRRAQRAVDHVLSTWHGEAAELFRTRWLEWNHGALAVIDQLTTAADALDQVRHELTGVDHQSGQSAVRLTGRLG